MVAHRADRVVTHRADRVVAHRAGWAGRMGTVGPDPAVAAVRLAVRRGLGRYRADRDVYVACSGGPDSTALAAATAFEVRRTGRQAGLITIDHGLQAGSAEQAVRVAALGYELGLDPVHSVRVSVGGSGGPEAAARTARYAALEELRTAGGEPLILLGHTADDQAETVLLGLGRGSGARSMSGMRPDRDGFLRPLLGLRRSQTVACCRELGLPVYDDPHNSEPRFRRVRVRTEVLPLLEDVLAGGVVEALARTAQQLQEDCDALDGIAGYVRHRADLGGELAVAQLRDQPRAVLTRVLKSWAESGGSEPLAAVHVLGLASLITDWHGQAAIQLPGRVAVCRRSGRLMLIPSLESTVLPDPDTV